MKSFCKDNIIHNLITAITILFVAIIMHSCEYDEYKDATPYATSMVGYITQTETILHASVIFATSCDFEYGTS